MAKPLKAIGSIITVVIFLALIALTLVLYDGSPEQKVSLEQNFFWRNTKIVLDSVWTFFQGSTDMGLGKKSATIATSSDAAIAQMPDTGWFQKIGSDIQDEWNKGGETTLNDVSEINLDKVWEWRKNATGAEIILKGKNGEEYKVALPFKFLSE